MTRPLAFWDVWLGLLRGGTWLGWGCRLSGAVDRSKGLWEMGTAPAHTQSLSHTLGSWAQASLLPSCAHDARVEGLLLGCSLVWAPILIIPTPLAWPWGSGRSRGSAGRLLVYTTTASHAAGGKRHHGPRRATLWEEEHPSTSPPRAACRGPEMELSPAACRILVCADDKAAGWAARGIWRVLIDGS